MGHDAASHSNSCAATLDAMAVKRSKSTTKHELGTPYTCDRIDLQFEGLVIAGHGPFRDSGTASEVDAPVA